MDPKTTAILIKLNERDRKDLESLAERWNTTLAEAARRAIRDSLKDKK